MKQVRILILMLGIYSGLILADDFIFFDDSPSADSYDPSWANVTAPSLLNNVGEKFAVTTDIYFQGENCLSLGWTSNSGGDWQICVAEIGWPGHDITQKDTLSFWVYTDTSIVSANLPCLQLEDLSNTRSDIINMSDYIGDIPDSVWYNVRIPLQPFIDNAGSADMTSIKTIFYRQGVADGNSHLMYIDEIRMVSGQSADTTPPAIPVNVAAKGYEKHVTLTWDLVADTDVAGYNIYRAEPGGDFAKVGAVTEALPVYTDFHGNVGNTYEYIVTAYDDSYNESDSSEVVAATSSEMDDEALLDMVQEMTFRYFWDYAHPISGLSRERYPDGPETVTSGGSGMGLMAIPVGIERGFITRSEGVAHVLKMLKFLNTADRFHGAWSHWINGSTGEAIPFSTYDDGGDLVETAYVAEGLLTVRQYFNQDTRNELQIRTLATELWEEIEWDWYRRYDNGTSIYWHWSENYGWQMNMPIYGYNECMIVYLLAIASPTHGVPASLWESGWASQPHYDNGGTFYGITQDVGWDKGGPLFFTHYSFLGFDPRGKKDSHTNYFENNRAISLINQAWCIENSGGFTGYSDECWGLTASDDPLVGYMAHEPTSDRDNGTITPTAALSAFPYTPEESMKALKHFYRDLGEDLVGPLGFLDAFNQTEDWVAGTYIAIDQGPIVCMIENHRSNLLWDNFMANTEIDSMLDAIGFVPDDSLTIEDEVSTVSREFELLGNYPNPFNPETNIRFNLPERAAVTLSVYNLAGQWVSTEVFSGCQAGFNEIKWSALNGDKNQVSTGVYLYQISYGHQVLSGKMVLFK